MISIAYKNKWRGLSQSVFHLSFTWPLHDLCMSEFLGRNGTGMHILQSMFHTCRGLSKFQCLLASWRGLVVVPNPFGSRRLWTLCPNECWSLLTGVNGGHYDPLNGHAQKIEKKIQAHAVVMDTGKWPCARQLKFNFLDTKLTSQRNATTTNTAIPNIWLCPTLILPGNIFKHK